MIKGARELVEINNFTDVNIAKIAARVAQEVKDCWEEALSKAHGEVENIKVTEKRTITQLLNTIDLTN